MAETSIEVSLVELDNVGAPGPSGNTSHMIRHYTSEEVETGTGGEPPPTTGQLWPRGNAMN